MARYSKKRGDVRPIGRATHTAARLAMRDKWWEPVMLAMRTHFLIPGAKHAMSLATGIADSQLHCYSCDDCEHNQEPTYSTAMTIILYLAEYRWKAKAIVTTGRKEPSPYMTLPVLELLNTLRTGVRSTRKHTSPNRHNLNKFSVY